MFLRQLEYLTALARERHFGRAARAAHVSQPALSAAIRKLERELGVPLVYRGQRYDDLTPEGRTLLHWAQQALSSIDGLSAEASRLRHQLTGKLRLGVIPTAMPAVSLIAGPLLKAHAEVRLEVRSLSSIEIGRQLAAHELDAGITYLDNEPLGAVASAPIYRERYILLRPDDDSERSTIRWADLSGVPLCLLAPEMQNRRIVDAALRTAGVEVRPRVEANSISALLSFARAGWSCVIAHAWLALRGVPSGMSGLALTDPDLTHEIGLVYPDTDLLQPTVRALRDELKSVDVDAALAGGAGPEPAYSSTSSGTRVTPRERLER